jgi:glycosyltransferase involved in cell wall biosynthesis
VTVPWHFITGEYPPDPGGISDYCGQLAAGLADCGAEVHVWTGGGEHVGAIEAGGVEVHRAGGAWTRADLARVGLALDAQPGPRRLFIQYAPNAFGRRGMNLPFCDWLVGRRRCGDDVRILFHEVRYLVKQGDSLARRALSLVQREMARRLLRASSTTYVTIHYWRKLLALPAPFQNKPPVAEWLPVPSNVPILADPDLVQSTRRRFAPDGQTVVGSFGTFHGEIGAMTARVFGDLLRGGQDRVGLLIGRGGEALAASLAQSHPDLADRMFATGGLTAGGVSAHLQACDMLVQPYPDGICTKRTTAMAGIAHGRPVISTTGKITDPIWTASGAVALAPDDDLPDLVRRAERLIGHPEECRALGNLGRKLYEEEFSLSRLIERVTDGGQGS